MNKCDQTFRDFLATHEVEAGTRAPLVIGLSGGLDSTVLLHLAHRHAGGRLRAIHVNHGYSPNSEAWQAHCERFCRQLGVALESYCLPPGSSDFSESEARAERYRRFSESLADDEVLLLAHHRDDAAETLLLHLFQGRGSYAMPASRELGKAQLWRPLLTLGREELRGYALHHELDWLEDPSNDDRRHDRNYLRHDIMPRLSERFESLPQRLVQAAAQHQTMETLLTRVLDLDVESLPLSVFITRPSSEQLTIVRLWLRARQHLQPSTKSLVSFLDQLASASADRQPELQWGGLQLRRFENHLWCVRTITPRLQSLEISGPGEWQLPQGRLFISSEADGDPFDAALVVHFWQSPEFNADAKIFCGGHRRSIKEALRAAGVPPWRRAGYPIVADDSGVLCVPGVARRDDAAADEVAINVDWQPDD